MIINLLQKPAKDGIPAVDKNSIKGIKVTQVGSGYWKDFYVKRQDPFKRDYYWFSGEYYESEDEMKNDDIAVKNNFVSVTPIKYQLTNFEELKLFAGFENETKQNHTY